MDWPVCQAQIHLLMSKVEDVGSELLELSPESRYIREPLNDYIEGKFKSAPDLEHSILWSEGHLAHGEPARVREPQGS